MVKSKIQSRRGGSLYLLPHFSVPSKINPNKQRRKKTKQMREKTRGRAKDGKENNREIFQEHKVHKFNIFFHMNQCLLYQQSTLNCKHQRKQEGRKKGNLIHKLFNIYILCFSIFLVSDCGWLEWGRRIRKKVLNSLMNHRARPRLVRFS